MARARERREARTDADEDLRLKGIKPRPKYYGPPPKEAA